MSIKFKVSGVQVLLNGIDEYSREVHQKIESEIEDWSNRTVADAKRDVPIKTGDLKASIRSVVASNGLQWIVKAGGINGVNYAPYVEFGTGAFVDQSFLQEYGLVQYARQFKGKGEREVNLPSRSFLYRNARTEFNKTFAEIKKIVDNSWK